MDRIPVREDHKPSTMSPEEIEAILVPPEGGERKQKPGERLANRNTRWFAEVALVKQALQKMEELMAPGEKDALPEDMSLADLYRHHKKVKHKYFNAEEEAKVDGLIAARLEEIQGAARSSKTQLDEMKKEIAIFESELGEGYNGCEVKMRVTMHGSLCKRLHKLVKNFQAMQVERQQQHKSSILSHVKLVMRGENGAAMDPAKVDEMVDTCMQTGADPFQAMHEGGMDWHRAESALDDVREKHADIMKLEASISELADMFNDLALLVSAQGEVVDRIEKNVSNTSSYTQSAVRDLQKSNAYGRNNRCVALLVAWFVDCKLGSEFGDLGLGIWVWGGGGRLGGGGFKSPNVGRGNV